MAGSDVAAMMPPVLEIRQLQAEHKAPNGQTSAILRDVSLSIAPGHIHGLVGDSGAGKSMVAKAILGLMPPTVSVTEGAIYFFGDDLLALPAAAWRQLLGHRIALIPQDPLAALNPARRIDAQLCGLIRRHRSLSHSRARAVALELLCQVKFREPDSVLRSYPHQLSGGMRQRVLIAMAFSTNPSLIIADEPTTALDVTVQKQVLRLLAELQAEHQTAILFVSHDLGVVAKICQSVSVIYAGMIIEQGSMAHLLQKPAHDFTKALFAATPRYDRPADTLRPVPQNVLRSLEKTAADFDQRRRSDDDA